MNVRAVDLIREDCLSGLEGRSEQLSPLRGDTVVITGGTGFTGTWLAEMIAALNDQYSFGTKLILISRSTDHFKSTRPHLANRADITLVKSDVRYMVELPKETNWVIHAAANPDNRFHSTNPIEAMAIISDGTFAVLKAVDRCGDFKMFLNLSSGLIYGSQPLEVERISEHYAGAPSCGSVSSVYAEAKRFAETLCAAARSQARIPLVTARPFAFIGPYQSMDTPWAINNFIRDALNGSAIRVHGDGQTVRSYMYPSDMAYWYLRILTGGSSGLTYNVGNPEGITLQNLALMIAGHFTPSPEIRLHTAAGAAKTRFVPEVAMAVNELGLAQKVSMPQAIERTIRWNKA